jgi:hypothetical protein
MASRRGSTRRKQIPWHKIITNKTYKVNPPRWSTVPRLNADKYQRVKRNRVFRYKNSGTHGILIPDHAKRTPVQHARVAMFNKYQTQQGMRANVAGSWNVNPYHIT